MCGPRLQTSAEREDGIAQRCVRRVLGRLSWDRRVSGRRRGTVQALKSHKWDANQSCMTLLTLVAPGNV